MLFFKFSSHLINVSYSNKSDLFFSVFTFLLILDNLFVIIAKSAKDNSKLIISTSESGLTIELT